MVKRARLSRMMVKRARLSRKMVKRARPISSVKNSCDFGHSTRLEHLNGVSKTKCLVRCWIYGSAS